MFPCLGLRFNAEVGELKMKFPVICPFCSEVGDLRMFSNKGMLIWHIKSKHSKGCLK